MSRLSSLGLPIVWRVIIVPERRTWLDWVFLPPPDQSDNGSAGARDNNDMGRKLVTMIDSLV